MVRLVNAYLDPVVVDYTRDVVPLTPCGNATERHILVAYDAAARRHFPAREDLLGFWAERLGLERAAVGAFLGEDPFPHDAIRSKLMKQGGPGYMLPGPGSFPALDEIVDATQACGALPCYAFLDGTNRGEQDMASQLEYLIERGIVALVVIPERNWNVSDAGHAQELVQRLHQALDVAQAMDFPVFIGTEMNKPGQRQIDDLSVPALRAYARQFQQGADMLYAHTALARTGGLGYHSEWARAELPSRAQRARFYGEIGRHMRPADGSIARAASVMQSAGPRAALRALCQ